MSLRSRTSRILIAPAVSLLLLGGVAAETMRRPRADEAEPYHARIREVVAQIPTRIGPWTGSDCEVQASAIELLKPNVILSRRYRNEQTGRYVGFLLVQCKDARDIQGHYPPNCYPASGSKLRSSRPIDWEVDGTPISGTEYQFESPRPGDDDIIVANFIITPGHYCRDMTAVRDLAEDYTHRFYGSSQVQVIFTDPRQWPDAERRETFNTIIRAYLPLIEQIRKGIDSHEQ